MKSPEDQIPSKETLPLDWRVLVRNRERIAPELAELIDHIVELLTPREIEDKFQEILTVQQKGNEQMHTNVPPREGFRISAIIDLGFEKGLITEEEKRRLHLKISY
jgi:hypothetical protein